LNKNQNFRRFWDSGWRLQGIFSSFQFFLTGQPSELTNKLKNLALNMFLVVNEPKEQEFSLKKSKFQEILGSDWRLHGIFSSSQIFRLANTIKTNGITRKLSPKHVSRNLLKFRELEEQEFSLKKFPKNQEIRIRFWNNKL
jgi:hypothetical protein